MPAEAVDKKKLEANFSVYTKIAEREFISKNFKSAIKSFKNVTGKGKIAINLQFCRLMKWH